jgi:hypothetical protein
MTGLKRTRDEIGAMYWPDVLEMLDYWLEFPPEHLLLRAMAGYEGAKSKGRKKSNWTSRRRRAEEMQDETYNEQQEKTDNERLEDDKDRMIRQTTIPDRARHLDCAPGHVQVVIEKFKLGKQMEI